MNNYIKPKAYNGPNGEIRYGNNGYYYNDNGPAIKNCFYCKDNVICSPFKLQYKMHYAVSWRHIWIYIKEFANLTEHKLCLICNDFCKQACFI